MPTRMSDVSQAFTEVVKALLPSQTDVRQARHVSHGAKLRAAQRGSRNMLLSNLQNCGLVIVCVCATPSAPLVAQSTPKPQSVNTSAGVALAPLALPKDYVI